MDAFSGLPSQPEIIGILSAAEALGLDHDMQLHAGPPLANPHRPPAPIASAAAMTLLHEGRVGSLAEADALINAGGLRLMSAQDHQCVTPLAAVVGPGTPLFELRDTAGLAPPMFAPVPSLHGPDTRYGDRDPAILPRLRERDGPLVDALRAAIGRLGPIVLSPMAITGLAGGDDLNDCTQAATAAFSRWLRAAGQSEVAYAVDLTPWFFRNPWMGACAQMLAGLAAIGPASLVMRAGGNGETFGITLAGAPAQWITQPAGPPLGARLPNAAADAPVMGAIGDSAVIDLLGFGAQRRERTRGLAKELDAQLPKDFAEHINSVFVSRLASFAPPVPVGIDVRRVVVAGLSPVATMSMLAADGVHGLLGRGLYAPGTALFERAFERLCSGSGPASAQPG